MMLPDVFKFIVMGSADRTVFTATREGFKFRVTWPNTDASTLYDCYTVEKYIQRGDWGICPETFTKLELAAQHFQGIISAKPSADVLSVSEVQALRLTCGLINRLLCDR